jgi:hypothetical protein
MLGRGRRRTLEDVARDACAGGEILALTIVFLCNLFTTRRLNPISIERNTRKTVEEMKEYLSSLSSSSCSQFDRVPCKP